MQVRAVDLSQRSELEELCAWLEREKIAIDFLINNAGLGDRGVISPTSEPQRIREMLAVKPAGVDSTHAGDCSRK